MHDLNPNADKFQNNQTEDYDLMRMRVQTATGQKGENLNTKANLRVNWHP